jgi:hypothetical protein
MHGQKNIKLPLKGHLKHPSKKYIFRDIQNDLIHFYLPAATGKPPH